MVVGPGSGNECVLSEPGDLALHFPGSNHLIRLPSVTLSPLIYLPQPFTPPSAFPGERISQVVCMTSSSGLSEALKEMLAVNCSSSELMVSPCSLAGWVRSRAGIRFFMGSGIWVLWGLLF